jgi:hypothetical protein
VCVCTCVCVRVCVRVWGSRRWIDPLNRFYERWWRCQAACRGTEELPLLHRSTCFSFFLTVIQPFSQSRKSLVAHRTYHVVDESISTYRLPNIVSTDTLVLSTVFLRSHTLMIIQGIHKRMVRVKKWITNLFLTLHEHNIHLQRRQLSKFLIW